MVTCFYRLANPSTLAMEWEAIAINSDFWSQVLQGICLKPLDFALGAVMAVRRDALEKIGGFAALADCLADDYQLGHRIALLGHRLAICPTVVECWSEPMGWGEVWKHQLRWARTIRVCQPLPYFFSILGNATVWPLLWLAQSRSWAALAGTVAFLLFRVCSAFDLQGRLLECGDIGRPSSGSRLWPSATCRAVGKRGHVRALQMVWLVPVKDLLQSVLWLLAFLGNRIEWRGQMFRMKRDGTLVKA